MVVRVLVMTALVAEMDFVAVAAAATAYSNVLCQLYPLSNWNTWACNDHGIGHGDQGCSLRTTVVVAAKNSF